MSVHVNTTHCTREGVGSHCASARVLSCAHVGRATARVSQPKGVGYPSRLARAAGFKFGTVFDTGFTEAMVSRIANRKPT